MTEEVRLVWDVMSNIKDNTTVLTTDILEPNVSVLDHSYIMLEPLNIYCFLQSVMTFLQVHNNKMHLHY